jgi:anti-anti-sigma regulatory factor
MTAQRPREIICDVGALAPDASSIDALARLQLSAKREGLEVRLCGASGELQQLLAFCGLAGVLGLEASRQAEQREQRGGVEEERHLDDPAT